MDYICRQLGRDFWYLKCSLQTLCTYIDWADTQKYSPFNIMFTELTFGFAVKYKRLKTVTKAETFTDE